MSQHQFRFGDYLIRSMSEAEFRPLFQQHRPQAFADTFSFRINGALLEAERAAIERLGGYRRDLYQLRLGIFHGDDVEGGDFVGWHSGIQASPDEYYMMNSAVLPAHQGKGLYTFLLPRVLDIVREAGFQLASSRHTATNNRILVPKLKAGFVITGMEISDHFGTLIKLAYFFNPLRRHALDVRSGEAVPSEELRQYMPL